MLQPSLSEKQPVPVGPGWLPRSGLRWCCEQTILSFGRMSQSISPYSSFSRGPICTRIKFDQKSRWVFLCDTLCATLLSPVGTGQELGSNFGGGGEHPARCQQDFLLCDCLILRPKLFSWVAHIRNYFSLFWCILAHVRGKKHVK